MKRSGAEGFKIVFVPNLVTFGYANENSRNKFQPQY
jgi:hypothetical protein